MWGSQNPWPFRWGGGPTETSKAYKLLKQAVGIGGSADREDTIDALWRRSRAKGLAAATSSCRRAVYNAWAHLATDALPYYERALGIALSPESSDASRRTEVAALMTTRLSAALPHLQTQLEAIDSRLSLLSLDYDKQQITHFGRVFDSLDPGAEGVYGGEGFSKWPNFSTNFIVRILFDVGYPGALIPSDARVQEAARSMVLDVIPSWVDYSITTGAGGFMLDVNYLDMAEIS